MYIYAIDWLPDDTLNKGTIKHHKTDGKSIHFAVHILT